MSGSGRVSIYIYIDRRWLGRRLRRVRGERNGSGYAVHVKRGVEGRGRGRRREREAAWSRVCGGDRIGGAGRGYGRGLIKPS